MFLKPSYYSIIFVISIFLHLFISTLGFNHTLSDLHGFRQSQTAISTDYLIKEGFINYIIPVLGAPWAIPIEFPLYQFIVAIFHQITQINLIASGRIISLLFFYLTLIFLNKALKLVNVSSETRILVVSLILCSPIYLFWSRTFMIESTALFLTILFLYFSLKYLSSLDFKALIAALIFGSLAALTKSTTLTLGSFFVLSFLILGKKFFSQEKAILKSVHNLIALTIIFFINFWWVWYSDYLKSQNPLAHGFITNNDLYNWYFGSVAQKLDQNTWQVLIQRINNEASISIPLLTLIILLGIVLTKYRILIALFLITFILGPLIFTNVYWVHNYYLYANTLYLQIALGLALSGLLKIGKLKFITSFVLIPSVFILLLVNYFRSYYPFQINDNKGIYNTAQAIKFFTNKDDVLLIYGYDWGSEIPFYAERKAIMDRWNYPLDNQKIQQSIKNTGKENISAMFTNVLGINFVNERIQYFNFQKEPVFQNQYGALYIK